MTGPSWSHVELFDDERHDIADFSCGRASVDDWFSAKAANAAGRIATHVCLDPVGSVRGFYALKTTIVDTGEMPRRYQQPNGQAVGILLAQMGLHVEDQGAGAGRSLLEAAMGTALEAHRRSTVQMFVLDVADKDEDLVKWYEKAALTRVPNTFRMVAKMSLLERVEAARIARGS